ncbi:hypothetical protein [Bacillus pumilus]|uniref:hypothetical protein n=1 Tax=Bacillus pumilus TaxID=1408 RepID=UPI00391739F2
MKKGHQELIPNQNGAGFTGYHPAPYPAYLPYTNYHPASYPSYPPNTNYHSPVNVNHSHHNFVPNQGMKWPQYFIVKPVFEEVDELYEYGKLISIDAKRNSINPEIINYRIYSKLADFYKGSIHQDEARQDLVEVEKEIDVGGVSVKAKLNGWIENSNGELCLRGKLTYNLLGNHTIDLGKECDPY